MKEAEQSLFISPGKLFLKPQTFLQSGKKHDNSDLVLPFTTFHPEILLVRIVKAMT